MHLLAAALWWPQVLAWWVLGVELRVHHEALQQRKDASRVQVGALARRTCAKFTSVLGVGCWCLVLRRRDGEDVEDPDANDQQMGDASWITKRTPVSKTASDPQDASIQDKGPDVAPFCMSL